VVSPQSVPFAVMLFLIAMALALFAILVWLVLSIPGAARATRVRL
jgi:hypothetical protein